jgi:hypothetical protein
MALPDIAVGDLWTADVVQSLPQGVVYLGNRAAVAGPSSGTTALGIERIDNLVLKAGYRYMFVTSGIRATTSVTTSADHFKFALTYSSAGAATSASSEIGRIEMGGQQTTDSLGMCVGFVVPGTTTSTASVLFYVVRTSGTGTLTTNNDTGGLWLHVIDLGVDVADTGVDV